MNLNKGWVFDQAGMRQKFLDYRNHKTKLAKVRTVLDTGRREMSYLRSPNMSRYDFRPANMSQQAGGSTFMTSVAVANNGSNYHRREIKKTDSILKDNVVVRGLPSFFSSGS